VSAKKVSIGRIGGKGRSKPESPTLAPLETGGAADGSNLRVPVDAVLVGTTEVEVELITVPTAGIAPLSEHDLEFRHELEAIVTEGIQGTIRAATALFDIHRYQGGILWRSSFSTFQSYCSEKWDYRKAHAYRLVNCGKFMDELARQSPIGDSEGWMPNSESQFREVRRLPKGHQIKCWKGIVAVTPAYELTGEKVAEMVKRYAADNVVKKKVPATKIAKIRKSRALAALRRLEVSVQSLSRADEIKHLLEQVKRMIGKSR